MASGKKDVSDTAPTHFARQAGNMLISFSLNRGHNQPSSLSEAVGFSSGVSGKLIENSHFAFITFILMRGCFSGSFRHDTVGSALEKYILYE